MEEQKKSGMTEKCLHLVRYISDRHISVHAASTCFFIVLAFFPTLVLLLGLVRYTGFSVETLTEMLEGVIPSALMPAAERLILSTHRNTSGTMVSLSALTALWSASRGIHGVLTGLNSIYGASESRGYLYTRGMSVFYTFAFLVVLLLTLVLHVFGKTVMQWLIAMDTPLSDLLVQLLNMRFFLLLIMQTVLFTAMYMFFPNQRNRLMESLPGALLSSIGWLLLTQLFSVYVENFDSYANIYGSVYAVALCMLWLYLCVCIVFYGGALNRWLKEA